MSEATFTDGAQDDGRAVPESPVPVVTDVPEETPDRAQTDQERLAELRRQVAELEGTDTSSPVAEEAAAEPEEAVFRGGTTGDEPHHTLRTDSADSAGTVSADSGAGSAVAVPGDPGAGARDVTSGTVESFDGDVTQKVAEVHAFVKRLEPALDSFIAEIQDKGVSGLLSGLMGGMFGQRK